MLNNFHEIKAVISNNHGFKVSFYGIAEYIHGMISNRIKFKDIALQSKLYFVTKLKESSTVKIKNNKLSTTLLSFLKPKENIIKFTNEAKAKLISIVKPKEVSKIKILNKPIQKINIFFNPKINENKFKFDNSDSKFNVSLQGRTEKNDILVSNNDTDGIHTIITLSSKVDNNEIFFQNNKVNASSWIFLKLGNISGTLSEIEKSPIENLGRRKIIQ